MNIKKISQTFQPRSAGWLDSRVRRCPSRGCGAIAAVPRRVAASRTTLSGFAYLSKRSGRRSGVIGSATPSASFRRPRGVPSAGLAVGSEDPPAASAGLAALSGFGLRCPPRSGRTGSPLLGFHAPSATSTGGSRFTRACLTRHSPSTGFSAPSTACSPSGLAGT
jgi:hypothetical protein